MAAANAVTNSCVICSENIKTKNRKKTYKIVCTIPCGHVYHEACLKTWFGTQRKEGNRTTCPTCRRETTSREIDRLYLYGISNYSAPSPVVFSPSPAGFRQAVSERSPLLNTNENIKIKRKVYSTLAVS